MYGYAAMLCRGCGIEDKCFEKNIELGNVKSEDLEHSGNLEKADLEPVIKRKKVNLHKRPEQIALA